MNFPVKRLAELERLKLTEILWIIKISLAITGFCSLKVNYAPIDLILYQPITSDFLVKSGFIISNFDYTDLFYKKKIFIQILLILQQYTNICPKYEEIICECMTSNYSIFLISIWKNSGFTFETGWVGFINL